LPVEAVALFSTLSKFMGEYPTDWDNHLRGISERGYNMVHFTPLMMRGVSNSPYSIYDQLAFDKDVFKSGEEDIAQMIQKMQKEYNLLAMTDVVWNHTANNSKWLEEHPESGYNVDTAPHLRPALELDTALLQFSKELKDRGLPTTFNSEADLLKVMDGVKKHVLGQIKLWEFYVVHVEPKPSWKLGFRDKPSSPMAALVKLAFADWMPSKTGRSNRKQTGWSSTLSAVVTGWASGTVARSTPLLVLVWSARCLVATTAVLAVHPMSEQHRVQ
jgi:hypothetical protein